MKIIERLNMPVFPRETTERYFKQIDDEAITLANEIWDRGNSLSYTRLMFDEAEGLADWQIPGTFGQSARHPTSSRVRKRLFLTNSD
jgi:hypothetical protein